MQYRRTDLLGLQHVVCLFASMTLMLLIAGSAVANQIVVDSGQPDGSDAYLIHTYNTDPYHVSRQHIAQGFTLSEPTTLTRLEFYIGRLGDDPDVYLTVSSYSPFTVGDYDIVAGRIATFQSSIPDMTHLNNGIWVSVDIDLSLPAGNYIVAVSPGTKSVRYAPTSAPFDIGPSFTSKAAGPSPTMAYTLVSEQSAFGLRVYTVPEPATALSFLICFVSVGHRNLGKKWGPGARL